jgi:hypothetical protein
MKGGEEQGAVGVGIPGEAETSAEYRHVEQLKEKLAKLAARVEALREAEAKMASEREGVEAEVAEVESELEAAVAAPAGGGRDPTLGLPDELLIAILLLVPFKAHGRCAGVCRRWRALEESGPVQRRKRKGKWEAYAKGWIAPRTLETTTWAFAVAVGPYGTLYVGFYDGTVRVWDAVNGTPIRTLEGHAEVVVALAVADDTVYSGSHDCTIRGWSGKDGTHIRTLSGHEDFVSALAVGSNGKLYSASADSTVRVWSTRDGAHIQTLLGHTAGVSALLIGPDDRVFSGSEDTTIRVWSADDGAHLQTLKGHTQTITSLVWGPDLKLYSGSMDCTIRVWSGQDGTLFKTADDSNVCTMAWIDGTLCAGTQSDILVWSPDRLGATVPPSFVLRYESHPLLTGELVVGSGSGVLYVL